MDTANTNLRSMDSEQWDRAQLSKKRAYQLNMLFHCHNRDRQFSHAKGGPSGLLVEIESRACHREVSCPWSLFGSLLTPSHSHPRRHSRRRRRRRCCHCTLDFAAPRIRHCRHLFAIVAIAAFLLYSSSTRTCLRTQGYKYYTVLTLKILSTRLC